MQVELARNATVPRARHFVRLIAGPRLDRRDQRENKRYQRRYLWQRYGPITRSW
jgi:hypothetical protein